MAQDQSIYEHFGVTPIVNARGPYTVLGGSRMTPRVWAAMEAANREFIPMSDLLDATGRYVAAAIGAEAARITPGASAGIALSIGACIVGNNATTAAALPDTGSAPNQVVIQHGQRYHWTRMARLPGAILVEAGDSSGTTVGQLDAAIGRRTAALLMPAHLAGRNGTLTLAETAAVARRHGVPLVVDAAFQIFPFSAFSDLLQAGADLAIFSAKYFGGPNTGGFVAGRRDLVEAVAGLDFTAHGPHEEISFGRAFKLDRQLVIGVAAALEEWSELDHGARFEGYERLVGTIAGRLRDVPGIEMTPLCFTMEETLEPDPINSLRVRVLPEAGTSAAALEATLRTGTPSILTHLIDDAVVIDVECLDDAEADLVGARLREALGG